MKTPTMKTPTMKTPTIKTYVIYFEDGSYFKCLADSELDAIIRAEIELRYEINRDEVKILSY